MAGKKRAKIDPSSMTRKQLGTLASRIRRKKKPTKDESRFLRDWEAGKYKEHRGKPASSPSDSRADTAPPPSADHESQKSSREPRSAKTESAPPDAPEETAPPPPPPPRPEPKRGKAGSRWQDKYSALGMDREGTCCAIGELFRVVAHKAAADIESCGATPVLSHAQIDSVLYPCAVIGTDNLLPPGFVIRPELVAATGSSALLAQQWAARRRVAKAKPARARAAAAPKKEPEPKAATPEPEPDPSPRRDSPSNGASDPRVKNAEVY